MSETKRQGRASNPNSARQQKLAARAALIASGGTIKRGRTANPNSASSLKKAERLANPKPKGRPSTKQAAIVA